MLRSRFREKAMGPVSQSDESAITSYDINIRTIRREVVAELVFLLRDFDATDDEDLDWTSE